MTHTFYVLYGWWTKQTTKNRIWSRQWIIWVWAFCWRFKGRRRSKQTRQSALTAGPISSCREKSGVEHWMGKGSTTWREQWKVTKRGKIDCTLEKSKNCTPVVVCTHKQALHYIVHNQAGCTCALVWRVYLFYTKLSLKYLNIL